MSATYAAVAEFDSASAIYHAAEKATAEGYAKVDAHTPFPVHGLDKALRQGPSHLGWLCLIAGMVGIGAAQLMMWWMNGVDYPFWVSGKRPYAWESTIPITFELMVLLASFAAVFGMLGLNRLPRLHNPLFKHGSFHRFSDDRFFLVIDATDPTFDSKRTVEYLEGIGGTNVAIVEDD